MPDILFDLKNNPEYQTMSVDDQLDAADYLLRKRLPLNPEFQALPFEEQEITRKVLLAKAPTFANPELAKQFKETGAGYMQGERGDQMAKERFQFVEGMTRGSGLASTIRAAVTGKPGGEVDHKRAVEYYRSLDKINHRESGFETAGSFVGGTAEAVAISLLMTPATAALTKATTLALRGGKGAQAALALAKEAGTVAKSVNALPKIHPALEMTSNILADAITTAVPLYAADEAKRLANGEPSIAAEGAGEVLRTIGVNAASNFLYGMMFGGIMQASWKFGKAIFNIKPQTFDDMMVKSYGEYKDQMAEFLHTRDPIKLNMMPEQARAQAKQFANIHDLVFNKITNADDFPLAKAQMVAHDTYKILERMEDSTYRIWEAKDANSLLEVKKTYNTLGEAKNYLAYQVYEKWSKLKPDEQAKFVSEGSEWAIHRGRALAEQQKALSAMTKTAELGDMNLQAGMEFGTYKSMDILERPVITFDEAKALVADSQAKLSGPEDEIMNRMAFGNGKRIAVATSVPLKGTIVDVVKKGELDFFRDVGSVRVKPDASPNMLFIGLNGADDQTYKEASEAALRMINNDPSLTLEDARANYMLDRGIDYYVHSEPSAMTDGLGTSLGMEKSVEFFTARNARLVTNYETVANLYSNTANVKKTLPKVKVEVKQWFDIDAQELVRQPRLIAGILAKSENADDLHNLIRLYMKAYGKDVTVSGVYDEGTPQIPRKHLKGKPRPKGELEALDEEYFDYTAHNEDDGSTVLPPKGGTSYIEYIEHMDTGFVKEGTVIVHWQGRKTPGSPEQFANQIANLFDDLRYEAKLPAEALKGRVIGKAYLDQPDLSFARLFDLFGNQVDGPTIMKWQKKIADKLGIELVMEDGAFVKLISEHDGLKYFRQFNMLDSDERTALMRYLLLKGMPHDALVKALENQGVFVKLQDGFYNAYRKQGKNLVPILTDQEIPQPIRTTSVAEIADGLGISPDQIDQSLGFDNAFFVDGDKGLKVALTVVGKPVLVSPDEAGRLMGMFAENKKSAAGRVLRRTTSGELIQPSDGLNHYTVSIPEMDIVRSFHTPGEATQFLLGDYKTLTNTIEMADKKYYHLTEAFANRHGTRYDLTSYLDGTQKTFFKLDEVIEFLQEKPDFQALAPNILDSLDPSIELDTKMLPDLFPISRELRAGRNKFNQPPEIQMDPHAKAMGAWMTSRAALGQFTSWIRDVAVRTNRPKLLEFVNEFQQARRITQVDSLMGNKFIEDAFKGANGKTLPLASRQKIFYHLGRQNSEDAATALGIQAQRKGVDLLEPLTNEEMQAVGKVSEFLDNLSHKFGFEFKDLIFKYMPMIRDFNNPANRELLNRLDLPEKLANAVFKGNVPRSVKFWAKNERTNEIFAYMVKDDPLELLMLYNAQGHKKLYLDEPWDKIFKYVEKDPISDVALKTRLVNYREMVMGYYHTPGEKIVSQWGEKFFVGLKDNPATAGLVKNVSEEKLKYIGQNVLRNYMSLTYMTQLGLKPWTAIRNSLQCMTTLAPRFGLSSTIEAMDQVLKSGDDYFVRLRQIGIISENLPIVDEILAGESKLGKLTEKSLVWLKNGDDFSRAIGYRVATNKFDEALTHLAMNPKDIDGFHRISGLSVIDPINRQQITELVMKGQKEAAKDFFGAIVVKDTAFTNDGAEGSMLRQGLIGKLFGQYGSYSESYRANMFNMLKYGRPEDRVRMVATYLAICGVMTNMFTQMGVKTNDFLPVGPGVFTGGPSFHYALSLIKLPAMGINKAAGNWSIADSANLQQFKFQSKSMVPGGYQVRYFQYAKEYFEQGDFWKGWLSMTGVPTTRD